MSAGYHENGNGNSEMHDDLNTMSLTGRDLDCGA